MENMESEAMNVMPVKRKDGTYAVRLCLHQGLFNRAAMKTVQDVMDTFGLTDLRVTTGQRLNLEGVPADKLDSVLKSLGNQVEKCPPGISVCAGGALCKYGKQETREITDRLLAVLKSNAPYPFKVKSGVSGCAMACGLSFVRDLGLIGGAKGWTVLYGGAARHRAAPGLTLAKGVSADEALELIEKGLAYYKENGRKGERLGMMVRRLGSENVLDALT